MEQAPDTLRGVSDRLDALLRSLDAHQDLLVRQQASEAVELLMSLQGAAFERVLAIAADPAAGGPALIAQIADDPLLGPLLLVHDIHPHDLETRISRRLERLRGRIAAFGCRASRDGIDGNCLKVRVAGMERISADRSAELHRLIETTLLEAAPELTSVAIVPDGGGAPALLQIIRNPETLPGPSVPNL